MNALEKNSGVYLLDHLPTTSHTQKFKFCNLLTFMMFQAGMTPFLL